MTLKDYNSSCYNLQSDLDWMFKSPPKGQFQPVVPLSLPMLVWPAASILVTPLNETLVQKMLATPFILIDKVFFLEAADIYYQVEAVELFKNSSIFQLQYDGTRWDKVYYSL